MAQGAYGKTEYRPTQFIVGVQSNDKLSIGGEKYTVKAVTNTALLRLVSDGGEETDVGRARLRERTADAEEVTVTHV